MKKDKFAIATRNVTSWDGHLNSNNGCNIMVDTTSRPPSESCTRMKFLWKKPSYFFHSLITYGGLEEFPKNFEITLHRLEELCCFSFNFGAPVIFQIFDLLPPTSTDIE